MVSTETFMVNYGNFYGQTTETFMVSTEKVLDNSVVLMYNIGKATKRGVIYDCEKAYKCCPS